MKYRKAVRAGDPGTLGVFAVKDGKWTWVSWSIKALGPDEAWRLAKECAANVEARMTLVKRPEHLKIGDMLEAAADVWVATERAEAEARLPALAVAPDGAYAKSFIVDAFKRRF